MIERSRQKGSRKAGGRRSPVSRRSVPEESSPRKLRAAVLITLLISGALLVLTVFFIGVALNVPYEADQATMVVLGKGVLDGNPLLRGWTLGNQAYFTTELPFYALGVWLLGFTWKVMYVVTGLHWAMLAVAIILLSLPGPLRQTRLDSLVVVTSLVMFLPALLVNTLYLSNAHLVGFFYCLISLASIRRLEEDDSWPKYLAFSAFLILALVGDTFGLFLLAIPVILVSAFRILTRGLERPSARLLLAAVGSILIAKLILYGIEVVGGADIPGPPTSFIHLAALENNVYLFLQGFLNLFAVQFFGQPVASIASAIGLLHLSAIVLFLGAFLHYARRFQSAPVYQQVLVAMIAFNVIENILSSAVRPGTTRYLSPILIFGIPMVSMFIVERGFLRSRRALLLGYMIILGLSLIPRLTYAKPTSQADGIAKLLVQLDLKNGYGPYWRSNSATVAAAGQVTVRPVYLDQDKIVPCRCFSDESWYHDRADFLIVQTDDTSGLQPGVEQATSIFGEPIGRYGLGAFGYLLVWDHDITPFILNR